MPQVPESRMSSPPLTPPPDEDDDPIEVEPEAEVVQVDSLDTLDDLWRRKELDPNTKRFYPYNASLNAKVSIWRGDITTLAADVIVNAANRTLLGGGGVDGAIHRAAGPGLFEECRKLGGANTGETKMTKAYRLPSQYIAHSVGPVYSRYRWEECEDALHACYRGCFDLTYHFGLKSVATCSISTGIYGYPLVSATHVAIQEARCFLEDMDRKGKQMRVVFVVYSANDERVYRGVAPFYFPGPADEKRPAAQATDPGTSAMDSAAKTTCKQTALNADAGTSSVRRGDEPVADPIPVQPLASLLKGLDPKEAGDGLAIHVDQDKPAASRLNEQSRPAPLFTSRLDGSAALLFGSRAQSSSRVGINDDCEQDEPVRALGATSHKVRRIERTSSTASADAKATLDSEGLICAQNDQMAPILSTGSSGAPRSEGLDIDFPAGPSEVQLSDAVGTSRDQDMELPPAHQDNARVGRPVTTIDMVAPSEVRDGSDGDAGVDGPFTAAQSEREPATERRASEAGDAESDEVERKVNTTADVEDEPTDASDVDGPPSPFIFDLQGDTDTDKSLTGAVDTKVKAFCPATQSAPVRPSIPVTAGEGLVSATVDGGCIGDVVGEMDLPRASQMPAKARQTDLMAVRDTGLEAIQDEDEGEEDWVHMEAPRSLYETPDGGGWLGSEMGDSMVVVGGMAADGAGTLHMATDVQNRDPRELDDVDMADGDPPAEVAEGVKAGIAAAAATDSNGSTGTDYDHGALASSNSESARAVLDAVANDIGVKPVGGKAELLEMAEATENEGQVAGETVVMDAALRQEPGSARTAVGVVATPGMETVDMRSDVLQNQAKSTDDPEDMDEMDEVESAVHAVAGVQVEAGIVPKTPATAVAGGAESPDSDSVSDSDEDEYSTARGAPATAVSDSDSESDSDSD